MKSHPHTRLAKIGLIVLVASSLVASCTGPRSSASLKVLTYSSLNQEGGLGDGLEKTYSEICSQILDAGECEIEIVAESGDASLSSRFLKGQHDAVLGLNQIQKNSVLQKLPEAKAVLFATSPHAWIADTKVFPKEEWPTSWSELSKLKNKANYADPRLSSAGLGLLKGVFVHKLLSLETLKQINAKVLPSWSQSYSAFTEGKHSVVWSYQSSEAYHRCEENSDRYQAIPLKEGYPQQEEWLVLYPNNKKKQKGLFEEALLSPKVQKQIPLKNWMYPVLSAALPECYSKVTKIKALDEPSEKNSSEELREWLDLWSVSF